jgi:hypothetical protein
MSSQYFNDPRLARLVPDGNICLSINNNDTYVFNSQFNNNLIQYNHLYYTGVASLKLTIVLPTLEYFERRIMKYLRRNSIIIDIGCGQGEFVNALRTQGLKAFGFDPVLKIENEYTYSRFWTRDDFAAELYVMRCVLPHILDPWNFIETIQKASTNCLILIEFQRLEWILENKMWWSIGHEHVNYFQEEDFRRRYVVVDSGKFSHDEWGWVLIDSTREIDQNALSGVDLYSQVELLRKQFQFLDLLRVTCLQEISKLKKKIAIWGGGG